MIRASGPEREDDRILRAKYLDWCSARLAERFLQLTPDEIYELAHRASAAGAPPERDASPPSSPDSPEAAEPASFIAADAASFREIVEMVTQELAAELALPAFEVWRESYNASPDQYDHELLGLWRDSL